MLLHREPARWWEVTELAGQLRPATVVSESDAARYVEQFLGQGLIVFGPDRRLQYRPASEVLLEHVGMLAQAYKERPVTLFRMIYALRDAKIQSFAEAFRLRRKR